MRTLTAGFLAELAAGLQRPRFLFRGDLSTGELCYWNGLGDLSWNSKTWLGDGRMLAPESYRETENPQSESLAISLAGEASGLIATILENLKQNSVGELYLAFLNSSGAVIADPHLYFSGKLDQAELDDDPGGATIKLTYESIQSDLDRPFELHYTDADQQHLFPGDTGFRYVEQLCANWAGYWGLTKTDSKGK